MCMYQCVSWPGTATACDAHQRASVLYCVDVFLTQGQFRHRPGHLVSGSQRHLAVHCPGFRLALSTLGRQTLLRFPWQCSRSRPDEHPPVFSRPAISSAKGAGRDGRHEPDSTDRRPRASTPHARSSRRRRRARRPVALTGRRCQVSRPSALWTCRALPQPAEEHVRSGRVHLARGRSLPREDVLTEQRFPVDEVERVLVERHIRQLSHDFNPPACVFCFASLMNITRV
jgi:hypothetical protein